MHNPASLRFANHTDSAKEIAGRKGFWRATSAPDVNTYSGGAYAMIPPTAPNASAQDAFAAYSALQKAWAAHPQLENDPRFVAMRDEAYAAFRGAFDQ